MASILSHPAAALAMAPLFEWAGVPRRIVWLGAWCTIVPDFDVIGLAWGISYGDLFGHRGLTHSLLFAAAFGIALVMLIKPPGSRAANALFLFLCTASHRLFDALTDGGLGIAFFTPFDETRYFLPWNPIRVSPIGLSEFISSEGAAVLASEAIWIWIPALALFSLGTALVRHVAAAPGSRWTPRFRA